MASRLLANPELVARARVRVASWLASRSVAPSYVDAWAELLARPLGELA